MSHFVRNFLDKYVDNVDYRRKKRIPSQSIRKSKQCIAETLYQRRCRKRTAHTHKCWIHLAKQDNLRIKPSNIINGGKGLYSWKKSIPRGAVISKYTGRQRTKQQLDKKYGDAVAKYALCNARGRCVDANHTTDAAARFANDARNTPFKNNSIIQGNRRFRLKASKRILPHREIFTSYGDEYWV
jgi:hypothetical protein